MEKNEDNKLNEKYNILEKLGEGATANVFLVQDLETQRQYAAKVLKKEDDDLFETEVKMLNMVSNPFITNLIENGIGVLKRNGKIKNDARYVVMENAGKGDLFSYIYYTGRGLNEKHGKLIFSKILKGIQACHKAGVCHRDLKMENILLDEKFNPKICDFGFATLIKGEDDSGWLKTPLGTPSYTCPEILGFKAYKGVKADVFSLGVVLLNLVTCKVGFFEAKKSDPYYRYIMMKKFKQYNEKVKENFNLDEYSPEFQKLFFKMVSYDPRGRPSIEDILEKDGWMEEIRKMSPSELQNLEKEVFSDFSDRENMVKESRHLEMEAQDPDDDSGFRGVGDENEEYFSLDLKPHYGHTGINMKDYIKLNGDFNPSTFMNRLANGIKNEKKEKCKIEESNKNLKFLVTMENEVEQEAIPDEFAEELAKIELEDEMPGEKIEGNLRKKTCTVQCKLFSSNNGGFILRFVKKDGEIVDYYKNLDMIKKVVKTIS